MVDGKMTKRKIEDPVKVLRLKLQAAAAKSKALLVGVACCVVTLFIPPMQGVY
jgi:hypothetical protein